MGVAKPPPRPWGGSTTPYPYGRHWGASKPPLSIYVSVQSTPMAME